MIARVTALLPNFEWVQVETADGRWLALTKHTLGVDLSVLRVGQEVRCVVTLDQPRVIEAEAIKPA